MRLYNALDTFELVLWLVYMLDITHGCEHGDRGTNIQKNLI